MISPRPDLTRLRQDHANPEPGCDICLLLDCIANLERQDPVLEHAHQWTTAFPEVGYRRTVEALCRGCWALRWSAAAPPP